MTPEELLTFVIQTLDELKARDITKLSIHKLTDIADYTVICSGTSGRHVNAIADRLISEIKKQQIQPLGIEKSPNGDWTLVDLGDVIVHIMLPETREFYKLEKLWSVEVAKKNRKDHL